MARTRMTCPVDGGTNCFHERLPEGDTYMSFDCGYASNEHYKIGSDAVKNVLDNAPQLVKDLAFEDEARGIVWIPSVVQIPKKGIVFPDGTNTEQWVGDLHLKLKFQLKNKKNGQFQVKKVNIIQIDWIWKTVLLTKDGNFLKH